MTLCCSYTILRMLDDGGFGFTFRDVHPYVPLQIFTAIFYVNMDITMLSQFTYYKLKNQKEKLFVFLVCCPLPRPAALHTRAMIEISGFVCGHISCIFYLGSPSSTIGNVSTLFVLCALINQTCFLTLFSTFGRCLEILRSAFGTNNVKVTVPN
ncbi:hypothetical protein HPG69_013358 [Diceros bicornis minor]|uniref:Uncharacterized protein n=1 Tax=Diceros bicornis minor TaxID=77932 RepID=A0A7J7E402_DICBM|nr:hypothetical protein HPG69_013358 [Diceros bicornis minor]